MQGDSCVWRPRLRGGRRGLRAGRRAAAGPRTLTVMTFNIASAVETDNDLDPIADAIELQEADVAGLQEVDRSWSRSDSLDQAQELALRLGMTYRFDPVFDCSARDTDGDGFCRYGTAVVSRFSMRAATARDYSLPRVGEEEPRGLAQVGVNVRGRRLIIFNTHLSEVVAARRAQVREILRVVTATRGPVHPHGRPNAKPNAPEIMLAPAPPDGRGAAQARPAPDRGQHAHRLRLRLEGDHRALGTRALRHRRATSPTTAR